MSGDNNTFISIEISCGEVNLIACLSCLSKFKEEMQNVGYNPDHLQYYKTARGQLLAITAVLTLCCAHLVTYCNRD